MAECPECGQSFEALSKHWYYNEEHRPNLSSRQKDIITGLLMGDGSITRDGSNPRLVVDMCNEEFIKWLADEFGELAINLQSWEPEREEWNEVWRFQTRRLPELQRWAEWYGTDGKVFPPDVALTPLVLKMWYVSDGDRDYVPRGRDGLRIAMNKERGNEEKIEAYFEDAGLPTPNSWDHHDGACRARWGGDDAEELWEYMGDAPEGFKYKWP